eukprot:3132120-Rhodomonas_salina.1
MAEASEKGGSVGSKRKSHACGRVRIFVSSPDADVEPDQQLKEEKERVLSRYGLDPAEEFVLCSCGGDSQAEKGSSDGRGADKTVSKGDE